MSGDIIHLNVGGTRFTTSKPTLTWIPDSFFSSMLSGRISTLHDENGAIFIDRDPVLFKHILQYMRTKEVDVRNVSLTSLRHEAEFYSITPLVRRLSLCEQLDDCACGNIFFHGSIPPPVPPERPTKIKNVAPADVGHHPTHAPPPDVPAEAGPSGGGAGGAHANGHSVASRTTSANSTRSLQPAHSQNSINSVLYYSNNPTGIGGVGGHHVLGRTGYGPHHWTDAVVANPLKVRMLKGHFNWIAAAYSHFVCLYRMKESSGWKLTWTSPYIEHTVELIALNTTKAAVAGGVGFLDNAQRMIAAAHGSVIQLWSVGENGECIREIGVFELGVQPEHLFFIGSQLVALSSVGKVGVWHAMTQNWQVQDVTAISSYDTAGSFLLLGCQNGSIYYIDMEKFPLRMKDNDLLVTQLYHDPTCEAVTALSVYLTPKSSISGNWIEIAYGTSEGRVRVIVQHPETVGQGPQMFQTFTVHRSPICRIMLSEKYLISVCSEYNHVRSWSVTRFRGMISTQPGSMSLASFKVVSLEEYDPHAHLTAGNDVGPHGEKDDQQLFIQKVVPDTNKLFVRLASTGKRVCEIKSVDDHHISSFCVHECEGSNRIGARSRKFLFTGHANGSIQMWDLSTALELMSKTSTAGTGGAGELGGPDPEEILQQLDVCELSNSCTTTPSISPATSSMLAGHRPAGTPTPRHSLKHHHRTSSDC